MLWIIVGAIAGIVIGAAIMYLILARAFYNLWPILFVAFCLVVGCQQTVPTTNNQRTFTTLTAPPTTVPSVTPPAKGAGGAIAEAQVATGSIGATIEATTPETFAAAKPTLSSGVKAIGDKLTSAATYITQVLAISAQHDAADEQARKAISDRDMAIGTLQKDNGDKDRAILARDKSITALQKKLDDQATSAFRWLMIGGIALSVLGIGGGIAAYVFLKVMWGVYVSCIAGVAFAVCTAGLLYMKIFAIAGLVVAGVLVIGLLVLVIIEIRHQFKSVVSGVQAGIAAGAIDLAKVGPIFDATQTTGAKAFVNANTPSTPNTP